MACSLSFKVDVRDTGRTPLSESRWQDAALRIPMPRATGRCGLAGLEWDPAGKPLGAEETCWPSRSTPESRPSPERICEGEDAL